MIYGYARVSTKGQARDGNSLSDQKEKLKAAGAEKIFVDSFTGTKLDRPQFDKLKSLMRSGDTLVVTKLDRIARSANQGSSFVQEMIARGVRVHVLNMGMMDNTPTGKLIMNVMFAFAEFERDMIVQRTQEGKEIARQKKDYHEGRPRLSIDYEVLEKFREKQKGGELTIEQCCKRLGISRTSWYNYTRK
ncbi:MAG: recombinase family protein [Firmicutes bacterium]|nr:recombinase family protein [Bacillota bacterium]